MIPSSVELAMQVQEILAACLRKPPVNLQPMKNAKPCGSTYEDLQAVLCFHNERESGWLNLKRATNPIFVSWLQHVALYMPHWALMLLFRL
jgi:hypothetical protein